MLSMCALTYTTKSMAFNDSLKAFSFRCTYHVNIRCIIQEVYSKHVSELILGIKILKLGQVPLWSYTCFLKMTSFWLRCMLFLFLLKAQLNCFIAVMFYCFNLRNYTRTYFNNSAWKIPSLGTEHGCHSDFLS